MHDDNQDTHDGTVEADPSSQGPPIGSSDDASGDQDSSTLNGTTAPLEPRADDPFADIASLTLPQHFKEAQAKKILTRIRVRKPHKIEWFRVNGDFEQNEVAMVEHKGENTTEHYLLSPGLFHGEMAAIARPVSLQLGLNRQGGLFVWPVSILREGPGASWAESRWEAVKLARVHWTRIVANMAEGGYDAYQATTELPDPEWPTLSNQDVLRLAFKDHFIDSPDHPVYRQIVEGV